MPPPGPADQIHIKGKKLLYFNLLPYADYLTFETRVESMTYILTKGIH